MEKKIAHIAKAPLSRSMGPKVKQVIPSALGYLDPFVFLDHFGPFVKKPEDSGVPAHPHAGIATITYLFEGTNRHQDSLGNDQVIYKGDLAWMQAGKGIIHAEGMNENKDEATLVHGLQLWISLPAKDKFIDPAFYHYEAKELPHFKINNSEVKVIIGKWDKYQSPVQSLTPAFLFVLEIEANETLQIPIQNGHTSGLYLIEGEVEIQGETLNDLTLVSFKTEGEYIALSTRKKSHLVVLGGEALNEPIYPYASFVMNNENQINEVIRNYQQGKMGKI